MASPVLDVPSVLFFPTHATKLKRGLYRVFSSLKKQGRVTSVFSRREKLLGQHGVVDVGQLYGGEGLKRPPLKKTGKNGAGTCF